MAGSEDPAVSVVVPIWNPGRFIDRCFDSLFAQTLPGSEIAIVLVDDGSTDGTAERLDELAAEHPHIVVRHEPASGWAGRPRNVGIELARGRWVPFLDQDDVLTPDALARLAAFGDDSAADIVLGKVTSDWRPVDQDVFRRDRLTCTLANAPLIKSLTPHKMFRRSFLLEHDLRFPEGKRRLEDQLFMVQSDLAARNVAILSSYECYRYLRRDDGGNAGSRRIMPADYYRNLEEVVDAVLARTEPGGLRDALLTRFLHSEILRRLIGEPAARFSDQRQRGFITATKPLVERKFPPTLSDGLAATCMLGLSAAVAALRGRERANATMRRTVRRIPLLGARLSSLWVGLSQSAVGDAARSLTAQPERVVRSGLSSAANWILDAFALWASLRTYGSSVSLEAITVCVSLTSLAAWLPITPSGLGLAEGMAIPALVAFGSPRQAAVLGVLTWRLLAFWLPIPLGAAAYATLQSRRTGCLKIEA